MTEPGQIGYRIYVVAEESSPAALEHDSPASAVAMLRDLTEAVAETAARLYGLSPVEEPG